MRITKRGTDHRAAVQVLDEFLLSGQPPEADVVACLARIRASAYAGHLELAGVVEKAGPNVHVGRVGLLRLRLAFAGVPDPSEELLSRLVWIGDMTRMLKCYVSGVLDLSDFKRQYHKLQRDCPLREMGHILHTLSYTVSIADPDPGDPYRAERIDLVEASVVTAERLQSYWRLLLP